MADRCPARAKNMAADIGDELDVQNKQLDRLALKTESNAIRVQEDNKRARQML